MGIALVVMLFALTMHWSIQWDEMSDWKIIKVNKGIYNTNLRAVITDGKTTWQVQRTHNWFNIPSGTYVGFLQEHKLDKLLISLKD